MKKYIFLLIVMANIVIPVMAQEEYRQVYEHKIQTFSHLRSAGYTMTGFGAGTAITGAILLASLPSSYWYDGNASYYGEEYDPSDDLKAFSGIICIALGVGLLAGGITMSSIGSHKVRSYQGKLNNLSLGMICTPSKQGFTLTYRF
jgi:hypothetical protein